MPGLDGFFPELEQREVLMYGVVECGDIAVDTLCNNLVVLCAFPMSSADIAVSTICCRTI